MELTSSYHSVYALHYHLALPIEHAKEVITDTVSSELKNIFKRIANNYEITIQEFNHDKDHIHVIFNATPTSDLTKFINAYKSASSRIIKGKFPEIRENLWEDKFWSRSYLLATTGEVSLSVLQQYVQEQRKDH